MSRVRGYCITWNNYPEGAQEMFLGLQYLKSPKIQYGVSGMEVGESGTPHLQIFIYFKNPQANPMKKLKANLDESIHIEKAKGTPKQAADYCKKDKNFVEFGDAPVGQGGRTDIVAVRDKIKNGDIKSELDLIEDEDLALNFQSYRFGMVMLRVYMKPRKLEKMPEVWWFFGATGCGKSHRAMNTYPNAYWSGANLKWWDGYHGETEIIIDEFRLEMLRDVGGVRYLLRLWDKYPLRVECKGGSMECQGEKFLVTAPIRPEVMLENYKDEEENLKQILRRITRVVEIGIDKEDDIEDGFPLVEPDEEEDAEAIY